MKNIVRSESMDEMIQIITVTMRKTIKFRGPYSMLDNLSAREFIETVIGPKPDTTKQIRLNIRLNFHGPDEILPESTR